jgi:hypothetical protein
MSHVTIEKLLLTMSPPFMPIQFVSSIGGKHLITVLHLVHIA